MPQKKEKKNIDNNLAVYLHSADQRYQTELTFVNELKPYWQLLSEDGLI